MEVFSTNYKTVKIKGHAVEVKLEVIVSEDYDMDIDGGYDAGTPEENAAYKARFQSGNDLFMANVQVKASALGESASDYLGACHFHVNNYFNSEPFNNDVESTIKDHGMIDNAISELVAQITSRASELKKFS